MMHGCILQIEDEESDVLLLQHAFQRAGISNRVFVVNDGQEAVSYLQGTGRFMDRQEHPLPCLVLLDLKLPDKNGLDVLEWMRGQAWLKTTVVVALTSSDYDEDIRRAYELGVNSYVVKPASNEKRVQFAEHLKGWWLGCNQFARTQTR